MTAALKDLTRHSVVNLSSFVYCMGWSARPCRVSARTGWPGVSFGDWAAQTQNSVTYREAKTLLHSRYNGDWKKDNGGYQAHLDPIWRLERAQQTTIFRLRTGHCGLSAHLKRIGISDTSLCECGQADQTPDHVLQSCPEYAERRQLTWPHGADLATKLWGSAEDVYRTAGFVASAGLQI